MWPYFHSLSILGSNKLRTEVHYYFETQFLINIKLIVSKYVQYEVYLITYFQGYCRFYI